MQNSSERQLNVGLLLARLGIAASQLFFAVPRLINGAHTWSAVGKELRFLHADFSTQVVGGVLLIIEVLASLGLITGYIFRLSALLLAGVYGLYFFNFITEGYKTLPLYAGALACVCIGLMFSGPGRFAVSVKIESK
ncbi:MAG: hypothetical protein M0036_01230 [Desulfobacteraceae bacterium]|nr:hypothetical protein [Desulfobacteraceae bacterium]